jgi:hypothetical protein
MFRQPAPPGNNIAQSALNGRADACTAALCAVMGIGEARIRARDCSFAKEKASWLLCSQNIAREKRGFEAFRPESVN